MTARSQQLLNLNRSIEVGMNIIKELSFWLLQDNHLLLGTKTNTGETMSGSLLWALCQIACACIYHYFGIFIYRKLLTADTLHFIYCQTCGDCFEFLYFLVLVGEVTKISWSYYSCNESNDLRNIEIALTLLTVIRTIRKKCKKYPKKPSK